MQGLQSTESVSDASQSAGLLLREYFFLRKTVMFNYRQVSFLLHIKNTQKSKVQSAECTEILSIKFNSDFQTLMRGHWVTYAEKQKTVDQ